MTDSAKKKQQEVLVGVQKGFRSDGDHIGSVMLLGGMGQETDWTKYVLHPIWHEAHGPTADSPLVRFALVSKDDVKKMYKETAPSVESSDRECCNCGQKNDCVSQLNCLPAHTMWKPEGQAEQDDFPQAGHSYEVRTLKDRLVGDEPEPPSFPDHAELLVEMEASLDKAGEPDKVSVLEGVVNNLAMVIADNILCSECPAATLCDRDCAKHLTKWAKKESGAKADDGAARGDEEKG